MLARQALHVLQLPALNSAWLGVAPWMSTVSQALAAEPAVQGNYSQSFTSPPQSLHIARGTVQYPPQLEGNILGRALLTAIGAYSRKQQLRNGASVMYNAIVEAAENTELQQAVGLDPDKFMSTHHLLALHMWLIIRKLAWEGPQNKDAKTFMQALYSSHFYKDVERRIHAHGVSMHVSKWQKKLEKQFYGSCFAYDNAIVDADPAEFGRSLLKNVYDEDAAQANSARLLARYIRRQLACLEQTGIEDVFAGQIKFCTDIRKSI